MTATGGQGERRAALAMLGERLSALRLSDAAAVQQMRSSLERHGQLSPLSVYAAEGEALEVVDGFKRLRAAHALGWREVRVRVLGDDVVRALAAIPLLNSGGGMTELEEGWLCQRLHREHGLAQYEVAQLLGRHKSWVSRRLLLVEGLSDPLQAQVRLGLLAPRTASELARLPRGNQDAAVEVVQRRGLTTAQAARLVRAVLGCPEAAGRSKMLAQALEAPELMTRPSPSARRPPSPGDAILRDIDAMTRSSARLHALLRQQPLCTLEPRAAKLIEEGMQALRGVLNRLGGTLDLALAGEDLRCEILE